MLSGKCELLQLMMRTDLYGVSVMDANDVKSVNNYTLVFNTQNLCEIRYSKMCNLSPIVPNPILFGGVSRDNQDDIIKYFE